MPASDIDPQEPAHGALVGKTGPGATRARTLGWFGSGIAAFKSRPPAAPAPGVNPNVGPDRRLKFIPPLALFNDAAQWVDTKFFVRPMPFMQAPDSNPPLTAQYFTPPPINVNGLPAGNLNLQKQLGALDIQAAKFTTQTQNYFGT